MSSDARRCHLGQQARAQVGNRSGCGRWRRWWFAFLPPVPVATREVKTAFVVEVGDRDGDRPGVAAITSKP
jgi:hypothetical protein